MKRILCLATLFGWWIAAQLVIQAADQPRQRLLMDFGWRFLLGDFPDAKRTAFDDGHWRRLDLPHDWSIEGNFNRTNPTGGGGGYLPAGIGWYRRRFKLPESMRGRKIAVQFDGVYMNSDVWLNGQHLGNRPYGYISFSYDLTPYLNFGSATNVLAVRVDNSQQPNSRWYSGSGIYRHVWLIVTDPLHVDRWGTYVTSTNLPNGSTALRIRTRVRNGHSDSRDAALTSQVVDAAGQVVAATETRQNIAADGVHEFDQTVQLAHAKLWSIRAPYLYTIRSVVGDGSRVADEYETPIGIRDIRYDAEGGFFLNGRHLKMQGVCLHHDGGCVGAAVPEGVWERRLRLLKTMGCNAIRMSHNPPAPELLDLCDRLGFLVMDEAFDEWRIGKVRHGYSEYFDAWAARDLRAMLERDRNHPSIVMWSVGNEIREQTRTNGPAVLRPLVEICHREDPERPVTSACDNIWTDGAKTTLDFLNLLDIVGYNYADRWGARRETMYADDHYHFPQRKMVGSESVSIPGVRGDYRFGRVGSAGLQRAFYATPMIRAEQVWKFVRVHDYVIGDFLWTGIDYLGEARWPWKNSSSGVIDTSGFPKDAYYFYQSQWTDEPMLHLFPHWTWPGREGQIIPVLCYSSCDTVELFLNGKSYGVKALEFPRQGAAGGWNRYARPRVFPTTADLHLEWDVPYEPGVLKAVGRKDGKVVCTEEVRTAGAPAALELSSDRQTIVADARDVANFKLKVVDAQGVTVPDADPSITFEIEGPAKLIGVDNGNPASHESFKSNRRKAFRGLCLAVVESTTHAGKIRLTAHAQGLSESSVTIDSLTPAKPLVVLP